MHYWRKGMFQSLKETLAAVEEISLWGDYATYCRLRELGLRQKSLASLEAFIDLMVDRNLEQRVAFVRWIMPRSDRISDGDLLVPRPLYDRLIGPTLREWIERYPSEAEPHVLLGLQEGSREHLLRANVLDPLATEVRIRLTGYLLADLEHSWQVVPNVATPDTTTLATIRQASELLAGLQESDLKRELDEELALYKKRYRIDG